MSSSSKQYKFYILDTGEILQTVSLLEGTTDEDLNKIRQQLALDKGIEANSIDYKEDY